MAEERRAQKAEVEEERRARDEAAYVQEAELTEVSSERDALALQVVHELLEHGNTPLLAHCKAFRCKHYAVMAVHVSHGL